MVKLKCPKCDKKFHDQRYLSQHLERQVPCDAKFSCHMCSRIFTEERLLNCHLKRKTPCVKPDKILEELDEIADNTCIQCNSDFYNKSSLVRHMKTCKNTKKSVIDPVFVNEVLEHTIKLQSQLDKLIERSNSERTIEQRFDSVENMIKELKKSVQSLINENESLKKQVIKLTNDSNRDNTSVFIYSDEQYIDILNTNKCILDQWIYFIKEDNNEDIIKVGYTNCLKKRLSTLQTGNPDKLSIIAYIKTNNMVELEKTFHTYLDYCRISGEWFSLNIDDVETILENYRETGELLVV